MLSALTQRWRGSSFAMAKRASGALEHGRVHVVLSDSVVSGSSHARLSSESSGQGRRTRAFRLPTVAANAPAGYFAA